MNLPMDLVHIKQSAFASQKSHTMPRNHPWTPVKELATLLFPAYNGLCQSKPLCMTVYNTCQIAVQVKNLKRNANEKLVLAIVNDDDKTVSELVGFTNLKGVDQDTFMEMGHLEKYFLKKFI